jgi:protein TonB
MGLIKCFLSFLLFSFSLVAFSQPDPDPIPVPPPPPPAWVEDTPLTVSEIPAEYPGGSDALLKDLASSLVYPEFCVELGIEGKVFIKFIVEKNGKISNPEILKKPEGDCGAAMAKESVRVLRTLKDFKPATQNGQTVRVYMVLPIYFKLN